jgi:hypothetical protein
MNNPYEIHSWDKQYRVERLAEARMTHLEGRLREDRKACRARGRPGLVLAKTLTLLGAAVQPGAGRAKTW